ncbi:uncharacterized protein LOC127712959 [Mytilus californianus]|uniref:uncharacterized protein LOC127712959 n=1 Tax=Mytilus californianus TaxID=6549 RepID=UPI00224624D6|nr:uncharacterized protein LOC127712959 [Mytilus californianus]
MYILEFHFTNFQSIFKVVFVYITCCTVSVNSAPTCTEPTNLQAKFNRLNGGIDTRTLLFTEGWKNDTLDSDFEQLVKIGENKTQSSCPSTSLKGSNLPLMVRTSCPWFLERTQYSAETYPHEHYKATTKCTKCIDASGDQKCSPIQQKIQILKRAGCENGFYKYEITDTYIPVAYVCEQPREVVNDVQITTARPPVD